jgi:hypothetical protein
MGMAFAMLDHYEGERSSVYRIRMNRTVRDAMAGVEFVQVLKSTRIPVDYIVIKPAEENAPVKKSRLLRKNSDVQITANGYVSAGFLPRHWFGTGEKYKVKKAKDGSFYICLKERMGD